MDDFDDYFDDDIVLDDAALAVLDNEEKKFLSQAVPSTVSAHPSKRLKTNSGWVPGLGTQTEGDDFEDLPEVSVAENGTYDLASRISTRRPATRPAKPLPFTGTSRPVPPPNPQPSVASIQQSRSALGNSRTNVPYERSTPLINHRQHMSRETAANNQPARLNNQLTELEQRINKLRAENEKMQLALKEATDARLVKEGEVSVLRKNIEKSSQLHTEQIAKLKAAKDEADLKQVQIQKEMKNELQRLKTQFSFKQQEYEAMTRKSTGHTRQHRASSDMAEVSVHAGHLNNMVPGKPPAILSLHEYQITNIRRGSPKKSHYPSPGKPRKPAMLPGFQNSFVTSTPLPQPNFRPTTSKASDMQQFFGIPSQLGFDLPPSIHPPASPSVDVGPTLDHDGDITMDIVDVQGSVANFDTPVKDANEPDRKLELYQVILTHCLPGTQFTLHILLGSSISGDIAPNLTQAYSRECSTLLELMVGAVESSDTYESVLAPLCKTFIAILFLLTSSKIRTQLISFLGLLSHLTVNFQQFGLSLLDATLPDRDGNNILDVLFSFLQQLQTSNQPQLDVETLTAAAISITKVLCINADPEHLNKFTCIEHYPNVVLYLLDNSRTPEILSQSVSLFTTLANRNHEDISRTLLKIPDPACSPSLKGSVDDIACIRRMCLIVMGDLPKFEPIKPAVLTFFGALLISCSDAWNIFKKSFWVIPTLVTYLDRLSTPLWRDDESLYNAPSDTFSIILNISKITYLLYYLAFGENSSINMKQRLIDSDLFGQVYETFIVTMSRLSYAETPEWVDDNAKTELEYLSDIARELLDLVIDGLDGELAWSAYQRGKGARPSSEHDEAWEAELTKDDIEIL